MGETGAENPTPNELNDKGMDRKTAQVIDKSFFAGLELGSGSLLTREAESFLNNKNETEVGQITKTPIYTSLNGSRRAYDIVDLARIVGSPQTVEFRANEIMDNENASLDEIESLRALLVAADHSSFYSEALNNANDLRSDIEKVIRSYEDFFMEQQMSQSSKLSTVDDPDKAKPDEGDDPEGIMW